MGLYSFRQSDPASRIFDVEDIQWYPDAVVLRVYGSSEEDPERRGMVRVNYLGYIGYMTTDEASDEEQRIAVEQGEYEEDAYVGLSSSFKPTTDAAQSTTSRIEHPMNQQYGMISPPRVGDRVLVGHFGGKKWVILCVFPAQGGSEQPPHDETDLSIIHRSGSSVRFNDRYPSTQTGLPTDTFDGISGHMTLVGNRVMFLSGDKFLAHGLMSDFDAQDVNIDLNDDVSGGHTYASVFDNTIEPSSGSDPYYAPWDSSLGDKKFLQPPALDEGYAVVHDGGGLIRIEKGTGNHSNMRLGARGVTIYAGQKYWNAGLKGETTHDSPAPDSDIEDDVIKILHHSGAYIKIDIDGSISIVTASGQNYVIEATDAGKIVLGSEGKQVIGHGDGTTSHTVINAFGFTTYEAPTGHAHTVNKSQDEVWIP